MTAEAEILEPAHDIVEQITANPALAVLDMAKFNRFYDRLKDEVARVAGDVSTNKGRDEIRSTAYKIAQAKSAIEKARLKLTEDWRRQTSEANERGKVIKTKLEELADEVRRPLTEWEEAEKARQAQHEAMVSWLLGAGAVRLDESAGDVEARLAKVSNHVFEPAIHGDQVPHLEKLRAQAVDALTQAVERLAREEAERAELARLRAEAEARAAEEAAREAARLEAERKAEQERLERERLARVAAEAAERARREAEAEARRAEEERERAHAQALAAEKARADAAEAAARAERERQEAEARAAAEAERKRQEDREHRGRIMGAAKQALIDMGIDEPKAREIVLAIAAGSVPHCKMVF